MNYKAVLSTLGKTIIIIAVLMLLPLSVCLYFKEYEYVLSFVVPILVALLIGVPLSLIKLKDKTIYQKEGFVTVALVWIVISLIGAIPFVISNTIPNFVDAFFETVSGFTTTGASILTDVDAMLNASKSIMFWRMFTHWIGGMGVLVFILAIIPADSAGTMHIFRAESPGITASKFVSKMRFTARILYSIYSVMTIIEIVCLVLGNMPLYDSVLYTFSTAGTGGFSISNASVPQYNSAYIEVVMSVFMLLFSINFNVYYLIIIGQFAKAFKSEELKAFLIIVFLATLIIALNILDTVSNFADALRISFFQVTSIGSTTGLSTVDFAQWPALSKSILLFLTIVGACGGSTGGGIKVSRLVVLYKSGTNDLRKLVNERLVASVNFEGQAMAKQTERSVRLFMTIWISLVLISTMLLSIDTFAGSDVFTNLSSTLACIGNVGPGLTKLVGPMSNYAGYNAFSKLVLSFMMLAGRLELFPMLILFRPRTWMRGK